LRLKTAAVSGSSRRSAGREFHTDGPVTEKARCANVCQTQLAESEVVAGSRLWHIWQVSRKINNMFKITFEWTDWWWNADRPILKTMVTSCWTNQNRKQVIESLI